MFTGIIECIGIILLVQQLGREKIFRIKPSLKFINLKLGESISVNGVCLTVTKIFQDSFEVFVSAESLEITNLQKLIAHNKVNLERALLIGGRLNGHFVTGHIDTLGRILKKSNVGSSVVFRIEFNAKYNHLVLKKGSIALDGVSLTINNCDLNFLDVNIIPTTLQNTILNEWIYGGLINIEFDMLGKLVQKQNSGFKYAFMHD